MEKISDSLPINSNEVWYKIIQMTMRHTTIREEVATTSRVDIVLKSQLGAKSSSLICGSIAGAGAGSLLDSGAPTAPKQTSFGGFDSPVCENIGTRPSGKVV